MSRVAAVLALAVMSCGGAAETVAPSADAAVRDATAASPSFDARAADSRASQDAGPLPACHWPANLNPSSVPDGSIAVWGVGRAVIGCGDSVLDGGAWQIMGLSDSATSSGIYGVTGDAGPCVMGCKPDQYAISECDPADYGGLCFAVDAAVVGPSLPSGCGQPSPLFTKIEHTSDTSEGYPVFHCCPCE
jgi:hypothetical protein